MHAGRYASEWAAAVERTKRFGLAVPEYVPEPSKRYLTQDRIAEFPLAMRRGLGDVDIPDLMSQCMSIHYRLAPVLGDWLGCRALYTIGWVDDGSERGLFKFGEDFIADKLKNGHAQCKVNLHVWLTLPTMEIVDAALATTFAELHGLEKGRGGVLAMHADDVKDLAYKPMLVGSDFLTQAGLLYDLGSPTHRAKLRAAALGAPPRC